MTLTFPYYAYDPYLVLNGMSLQNRKKEHLKEIENKAATAAVDSAREKICFVTKLVDILVASLG